jgi:CheY-like chemotaxis protein
METIPFSTGGVRILVVEDEPSIRQALCQLLRTSGYYSIGAANGAEALALLTSFRPQAVLMDLMMPTLDGFEATRRLKADKTTRAIPVLAFTASTTAEDRRQALQAGVDAFLAKPMEFSELLRELRRYLPVAVPAQA